MTSPIHPSSIISPLVKLGKNVQIGPFCYLDGNITISDNTILKSHISISGNVKIGKKNLFYPHSNIGCDPQDLKFKGEGSYLIIGNNNTIRENVTISKGTKDGGMYTRIGDKNLFMTGVHIAHDCIIGNNNIFVNQVTLGGHVNILNNVVIGGLSAVIQYVTIGSHSMIGGMSGIDKNVLPFSLVLGNRAKLRGLNLVGIRRSNFSKEDIIRIKDIHKLFINEDIVLETKDEIDKLFIEYSNVINEKIGHIQ
jgi:UDP-N-acetylglucosamine acyltransferase